jgi:class 3 adenylate cyclase/tetratricopeptide (TPR) repeat protein
VGVCSACGAQVPEGARFCIACGSSLVPGCPVCGAERPEGARFCPSCGSEFADERPPPAGQERRLVTILFADVTGSTGLGERLDPERLREVLDTFFRAMREEIEAEGGTVEKFIGDAVMAAFGVPLAHEDDPSRALNAALRMRRRLDDVNDVLEAGHGVRLEMRTGVNTGEVLAATSPRPGEPMVTGDVVNVAARLEQRAAPGAIVVAERTARAARGFRYRELGPLALRGKDAVVTAVLLEEAAEDAPERGVPGLRAPMVGRDQELALLRTVYGRAVSERRPNLVTIYGDPGVGKSRLVREFVDWAEAQRPPPRVVFGRCLPYGDGVTYWPLAEILKSQAGVLDSDPTEVVLDKLQRACDVALSADPSIDAERACAAIAYTVALEWPSASMRNLEPRQVRDEMHAAWRALFSALAVEAPLIAVIEDIHWADPALLDLLEQLADRVVGPVVLVCPSRPELTDRRPGWGGGRRNVSSIAIDPLSAQDSERLVRLLLTVDDLPERVRAQILERAEGNPFFLEEIVRHLIDDRRIVREGERWRASSDIGGVAIPDSVQGVLAARIDLLDPADKRALQRAAVVGRVFWPGPVRRLLNGDGERLEETLRRLEERDLILSRLGSALAGEPEYIFKHVLTRDVAYESLPRRDRPLAHADVATWLEETAGDRRDEFVELLAYHYVEAVRGSAAEDRADEELRVKAFRHLLLASLGARRTVALAKAQSLARQAVELARSPIERSEAFEALAEALFDDYRGDEAYRRFREAADVRIADVPEDRRSIAYLCARTVEMPTRWPGTMMQVPPDEEVARYLDVGFANLEPGDSEERTRLLIARCMIGFATFGRGYTAEQLEGGRADGEEAAAMAERLGLPDLVSAALDGVGATLMMQGLPAAMIASDERRLALLPSLADPAEIADACSNAALPRILVGRYGEALEIATRGVEAAWEEAPAYGAYSMVWTNVANFRLGNWDEALAGHARLRAFHGDRSDPPRPWLQSYALAAFIADARAERVRADEEIAVVLRGADAQSYRSVTGATWAALLMARRGHLDEARRLLDAMTLPEARPAVAEARCDFVALAKDWDEAPSVIERARAIAERAGCTALPIHALRLEGRTLHARGDPEAAVGTLTRAVDGFVELEARWERACTELSLAEAMIAAERHDEARSALLSAEQVFRDLRSRPEIRASMALADMLP